MKNDKMSPLDRGIFWWYEWALRYVPLIVMLWQWYGVFDFHSNPREIMVCAEENEACMAYKFCMSYIFPIVMMLPASYFYQLCWPWRIPLLYMIGTSIIRVFYRSWLITNEMYDVNIVLIIFTCALYGYAFVTEQSWRIGRLFVKK